MSQKATMTIGLGVIGACLLCAGARPSGAQTPPLPELVVRPVEITLSSPCRNPAIAVSPRGRITVVTETGPLNAGRLAVIEFSFHGQSFPRRLEISGPGDCRHPCPLYDTSETLHLVWQEKTSETYAIHYAWRTPDNTWHDGGLISHTPELNCEFPQIAYERDNERLWVAWHAGVGTRFGIHVAWRDGASSFTTKNVTPGADDHYNLRPQLFPESPYPLVWYEEFETAFVLRAAVPDQERNDWPVITPLDFDRLAVRKTPELFQAPSGMLGGVWNDLVGNRNRVLLGLQDPELQGEGFVADTTLSGEAMEPAAVAVGHETVALAWVNREPTGSAIYIGRVDKGSRVVPSLALPASRPEPDDAVSRPRLAVSGGRLVHCVWYSDALQGGSGRIYYASFAILGAAKDE